MDKQQLFIQQSIALYQSIADRNPADDVSPKIRTAKMLFEPCLDSLLADSPVKLLLHTVIAIVEKRLADAETNLAIIRQDPKLSVEHLKLNNQLELIRNELYLGNLKDHIKWVKDEKDGGYMRHTLREMRKFMDRDGSPSDMNIGRVATDLGLDEAEVSDIITEAKQSVKQEEEEEMDV